MNNNEKQLNTPNSANVSLAVRNVSLAKKRNARILWSFICISCFSISVCIGYIGTFLLFN